jgi:hypothetical protein
MIDYLLSLKKIRLVFIVTLLVSAVSCKSVKTPESHSDDKFEKGTFGYDLNFLKQKDNPVVLKNKQGNAQVIVSAKYQGKVFTSTCEGLKGKSLGWINYDLYAKDTLLDHMNAYGSENRMWIGPEGGQFSIFFKPGGDMNFDNWFTPPPLDTEPWELVSSSDNSAIMAKNMQIKNYSGTTFDLRVDREIRMADKEDLNDLLDIDVPDKVNWVGYLSANKITNTGKKEWTRETGTLSIWMLSMFNPGQNTTVVIPFVEGDEARLGPVATTTYFGEITPERIKYGKGVIYFKVDGKKRRKLGLAPGRIKPVAGSYDEDNRVLTIVQYSIPPGIVEYVNQLWPWQEEPFIGDVMNAYNDGPLEDGSQLGPFYEIESSSPAAFLAPGGRIVHHHNIFHFTGDENQLTEIAKSVLGVSLEEIKSAF